MKLVCKSCGSNAEIVFNHVLTGGLCQDCYNKIFNPNSRVSFNDISRIDRYFSINSMDRSDLNKVMLTFLNKYEKVALIGSEVDSRNSGVKFTYQVVRGKREPKWFNIILYIENSTITETNIFKNERIVYSRSYLYDLRLTKSVTEVKKYKTPIALKDYMGYGKDYVAQEYTHDKGAYIKDEKNKERQIELQSEEYILPAPIQGICKCCGKNSMIYFRHTLTGDLCANCFPEEYKVLQVFDDVKTSKLPLVEIKRLKEILNDLKNKHKYLRLEKLDWATGGAVLVYYAITNDNKPAVIRIAAHSGSNNSITVRYKTLTYEKSVDYFINNTKRLNWNKEKLLKNSKELNEVMNYYFGLI